MDLELMKAFIWEYRFVIVWIVFMALFAWTMFKGKTYEYMMLAKSLAKDAVLKSGTEQEGWVIKAIYKFVPGSALIPESVLKVVVHHLYRTAKDKLDNGLLDNSIE